MVMQKYVLILNGLAFDNQIVNLITNKVEDECHLIWIGECDATLDLRTVTNPEYCDVPFRLQTDNVRLWHLRLRDDSVP